MPPFDEREAVGLRSLSPGYVVGLARPSATDPPLLPPGYDTFRVARSPYLDAMTVDLDLLAWDLGAASFIARPQQPRSNDELITTGRDLLRRITQPTRSITIRCPEGTARRDRRSVALATVNDRNLVITTNYRGRKTAGLRRSQTYIHDLAHLRQLGLTDSIWVLCWACRGVHEMSIRWLRRARNSDISDRIRSLDELTAWDAPPVGPVEQYGLALANWIGAFPLRTDQGQPIIATNYLYAASYYHHIGYDPMLHRLTLRDNPVELMPGADRINRPHPVPELLEAQLRIVGNP